MPMTCCVTEKELEILNSYNEFETKQTETLEHQLAYMLGEVSEYVESAPLPTVLMPDKDAVAKKRAAAEAEAAAVTAAIKANADAEAKATLEAKIKAKSNADKVKRDSLNRRKAQPFAHNDSLTNASASDQKNASEDQQGTNEAAALAASALSTVTDSDSSISSCESEPDDVNDTVEAAGRRRRKKFSMLRLVQGKVKAETADELFELLLSNTMRSQEQVWGHCIDEKHPEKWISMEYRGKVQKKNLRKKKRKEKEEQMLREARESNQYVNEGDHLLGTLEEVSESADAGSVNYRVETADTDTSGGDGGTVVGGGGKVQALNGKQPSNDRLAGIRDEKPAAAVQRFEVDTPLGLSFDGSASKGYTVTKVRPGSNAASAGIAAGMTIITINGTLVRLLEKSAVTAAIKASKGVCIVEAK